MEDGKKKSKLAMEEGATTTGFAAENDFSNPGDNHSDVVDDSLDDFGSDVDGDE